MAAGDDTSMVLAVVGWQAASTAVVSDITGTVGNTATFDGSGSSAQILSYAWTSVPGGSSIANAALALPDNSVSNAFDISMTSNVGLYHFENAFSGFVADSSGNSNTGAVSNATITTGKVGTQAYNFAAASANNQIAFAAAPYAFVSADAFSFSLWVKPDASQPGANAVVFSNSNLTTTGYAVIQSAGANSNLYTFVVGTGAALSGTGVVFALTAGTWNHLVVTRSANGTATKVYVNNVLVTNVAFLTTIAASGLPLTLGNFAATVASLSFNGDIDEFCVWSRELAAYEVEAVYDSGSGTIAAFGTTYAFTPDQVGTYTVSAEARSVYGNDTESANAVVSAAATTSADYTLLGTPQALVGAPSSLKGSKLS